MKFREWLAREEGLLTEDGFAGAGGNSWDVIYPTYADDYAHVSRAPLDHQWLQWRWDRGSELGRNLINIDNDEFQQRGYVGIESKDMPLAGESGWKHKPDSGKRGSAQPYKIDKMKLIAVGKTSNKTKLVDWGNGTRLWSNFGTTGYEPDCDLPSIFGDDVSGKFPEVDEKYMDAPFKKKYEG